MGSCCSTSKVVPISTGSVVIDIDKKATQPPKSSGSQLKVTREATGTLSLLSVKTGDSFIFPDVKDIPVLTHAPIIDYSLLPTIEETFWEEKRKLISDYRVMLEIDKHVLKASESLRHDPEKLVEYLIRSCKDDIQKTRALIRWMGEHIQYDTEFLKTGIRGDQSPQAVILSGKAVCEGYSRTFTYLGDLAGLECRGISGQAKGAGYYPGCFNPEKLSDGPGAHAWSAVKLRGRWFLCDATWAGGSVSDDGTFNKSWEEEYFLAEPRSFLLKHMPLDGDVIKSEEQLVSKPVTDAKLWAENALLSPQAYVYEIEPLTHTTNVIKHASNAELVIKYQCKNLMRQWIKVKKISINGNKRVTSTGAHFDRMIALFRIGTLSILRCRFQEQGAYEININASELTKENISDSNYSGNVIISYHVDVAKKCKMPLLPNGITDKWGIQERFTLSGYQVVSPRECITKAKNGVALVKIQLPTNGVLPNMFKLWTTGKELSEYCIAGRRGNKAYYIVQCPQRGEYRLDIYVKESETDTGLYVEASFLIQCDSPAKQPFNVENNRSFLGVTEEFLESGLTTSVKDSILQAKDGQARIRFRKERKEIDILSYLSYQGQRIENSVKQENDGEIVTMIITTPEMKFCVLELFAAPNGASSYPFVARFGVNNSKLFE